MSHLYPRPRPSGSRPIAQLAIDSPTKKMTAPMEETAGGDGIEQEHLTSWSVGACAPKQEKMLSLSHFSRCCNVVGVREREQAQVCGSLQGWLLWPSHDQGDFTQCLVREKSEKENMYSEVVPG